MKNVIKHISKDGMNTWFTGGIWWMAGKDIEVGEWDSDKKCAENFGIDYLDVEDFLQTIFK